jgi:hypothetical protein
MFTYYFNIGLIYFLIGFGVALFFYFVLKKEVLGSFGGLCLLGWSALFSAGHRVFFKGFSIP